MNAAELGTIIGIAGGSLTLGAAAVKGIYRVANMSGTLDRLTEVVQELGNKIEKIDERMYSDAVRNSERRR